MRFLVVWLVAISAACAVGTQKQQVKHTQPMPGGGARVVERQVRGFGFFGPGSVSETGQADIQTAMAGILDRGFYGGYGFGAAAYGGFWPVQAGAPYGSFTTAGMAYGDQLAQAAAPLLDIQVIQGAPIPATAEPTPAVSPAPARGVGGAGNGPSVVAQIPPVGQSGDRCLSNLDEFNRLRMDIVRLRAASSTDQAKLVKLLDQADVVLNQARRDCLGSEDTLKNLQQMQEELDRIRQDAVEVGR